MPVFTVTCKECKSQLKSPKPIRGGTVLTCPKCGVMFAAPKPVEPAAVDDVEVVEDDYEVIEDEPKKAAKPAKSAVAEERRPKRMARPKPKKSPVGLIIGLAVGAVCLVGLVFGGIWGYKKLTAGPGDVVAVVDGEAPVLAGADLDAMLKTPLGAYFELAFNNMPQLTKYKRSMKQEPKDILNKVAFSFGGPSDPQVLVALQGKSSFSKDQLAEAFQAKSTSVGGKSVYETKTGNENTEIYFPSSRMVVFTGGPNATVDKALRSSGRAMPAGVAEMHKRASAQHLWAIVDFKNPQVADMIKNAGTMPGVPAGNSEDMAKVKGMFFAAKFTPTDAEITIGLLASDAATASALSDKSKQDAEKMKSGAGLAVAFLPAEAKSLMQELLETMATSADGNFVLTTAKVKMATLEPIVQSVANKTSLMPPPPGSRGPR